MNSVDELLRHGEVVWTLGINGSKTTFVICPFGCLKIWHEIEL